MAAEPLGLLYALLLLQYAGAYNRPNVYQVIIPQELETREWPEPATVYAVTLGERTYTVLLKHNWSPGFRGFGVYKQNGTGHVSREPGHFPEHCYYQGYLEGVQESVVALSTCYGLTGFLQTDIFTYAIEPLKDSSTFQHVVYRLDDVSTVNNPCYNIPAERTIWDEFYKQQQQKKLFYNSVRVSRKRYMQLYVIVDHDLFLHHSGNMTLITNVVFNVLNMADAMFSPLYLKLFLVGLQVWNVKNVIPSSKNVHTFLGNLATWKDIRLAGIKADMMVLLRKDEIESVRGATYTGGICWNRNGVMFVSVSGNVLPAAATQLAHELGHFLGIPHDADYITDCPCMLSSCIMLQSGVISTSFSECSLKHYSRFVDQGGAYCLQTASFDLFVPKYIRPSCGNRIVEAGEQCDCGTVAECSRDPCCLYTCKLRDTAQCSFGECCINCEFAIKGTVCRKRASVCDLAEHCNGASSLCPADVYMQDGSPCNHDNSYCVSSRCYDYSKHCKQIFGNAASVASRECFETVNTIGDEIGNCGFEDQSSSPIKCEIDSAMCGRVQCNAVDINPDYDIHLVTIQAPSGDESCWSLGLVTSMMVDIGAVEDGAPCDIGKMCLARKCVNVSLLPSNCDAQINCSGRGVCNSNNNCHCNYGWTPPDCKRRGYGGSIDSGPCVFKSFINYLAKFKRTDVLSESSVGTQTVRQTFSSNLAIGLGVALPIVTAGVILAVIFRQRITALLK